MIKLCHTGVLHKYALRPVGWKKVYVNLVDAVMTAMHASTYFGDAPL